MAVPWRRPPVIKISRLWPVCHVAVALRRRTGHSAPETPERSFEAVPESRSSDLPRRLLLPPIHMRTS